jgi:DNA-binding transcriptional regulator LsrR (DeoR family)
MQDLYSDRLLHLAAQLYYVNGMKQAQLGKYLKISQAKVSRLLSMAQERGIVRIIVADFDPRNRELEAGLRTRLGLATAVVIKAPQELSPEELRKILGRFAAGEIQTMIKSKDIIAIGSGRNVRELVRNFSISTSKRITIVQSVGNVDASVHDFDAQEIGRVFSQRLGGDFLTLNMPAFVPTKRIRDALLAIDQARVVHACLSQARMAIVGVGTLDNSVFIERSMLREKDIAELKSAGAVGEIGGRFYNAAGRECDTRWRDQVLSIELAQLAAIPHVIGVVSGAGRSASILAAVAGGFLKGLVIDETGARALLETAAQSASAKTKKQK